MQEIKNKMNVINFNLNDKIKIKLTQAGQKYLKQKKYKLTPDKEGYLVMSLWEFSGIFGDALQLQTINPPVEPNITLLAD